MTKKDYEIIAGAISDATHFEHVDDGYHETPSKNHVIEWLDLVSYLGIALEKDNPNFDYRKFADACEPKEEE
jgi:hypothetical protein|tara:strand:+ start:31 stop:246 length:216 start_codon:yes stop_codon:yes gene_type:complete